MALVGVSLDLGWRRAAPTEETAHGRVAGVSQAVLGRSSPARNEPDQRASSPATSAAPRTPEIERQQHRAQRRWDDLPVLTAIAEGMSTVSGRVAIELRLILDITRREGIARIEQAEVERESFYDEELENCFVTGVAGAEFELPKAFEESNGSLSSLPPLPDADFRLDYPIRIIKPVRR